MLENIYTFWLRKRSRWDVTCQPLLDAAAKSLQVSGRTELVETLMQTFAKENTRRVHLCTLKNKNNVKPKLSKRGSVKFSTLKQNLLFFEKAALKHQPVGSAASAENNKTTRLSKKLHFFNISCNGSRFNLCTALHRFLLYALCTRKYSSFIDSEETLKETFR